MIVVDRIELLQAMKKIVPVIRGTRGLIVKIEQDVGGVSISGHDRLISPIVSVSHRLSASLEGEFDPFCINGVQLNAFASAVMSPSLSIKLGKMVSVSAGKNRVSLTRFNPEEFPRIKEPRDIVAVLPVEDVRKLLSVVAVTDPSDSYTPVRMSVGLSFEGELIRSIATDGNRCGEVWLSNATTYSKLQVLMPSYALSIIRDSYWQSNLSFYWNDNAIFMEADNFYIYSIPMQPEYPKELYAKVHNGLSDEFVSGVVVDPVSLKEKLRACAIMATSKNDYVPIKLLIVNNQLVISTDPNESGEMIFTVQAKRQIGADDVSFWVSSVYVDKTIDLLDFISGGGMEDINVMLGKETGWVFLVKPGLTARFAMSRFHRENP